MAVADTLQELATDIQSAYTSISNKGGTIPANKNTNNLATAINTISAGDDSELVSLIERTITEIENENVTSVGRAAFAYTSIQKAVLPNVTSLGRDALSNSNLQVADFAKLTSIDQYVFDYDSRLTTLVIRSNSVCTLGNVNSFRGTKFRNGTGGTVYVPYTLVNTYSTATNWSALESTTFASIQENLIALNNVGVDITDYYEIVEEKPTTDISTTKVYLIETQTEGTYEQWFYGSGSWEQLSNITL